MFLVPKWGNPRQLVLSMCLSLLGMVFYFFITRFGRVNADWASCIAFFIIFGLLADIVYLRQDLIKLQEEVEKLKK